MFNSIIDFGEEISSQNWINQQDNAVVYTSRFVGSKVWSWYYNSQLTHLILATKICTYMPKINYTIATKD